MRRFGIALAIFGLVLSSTSFGAQRCDLVARRCIDFASGTSASVTVPANTTRIPVDGMVLCHVAGSTPTPTDIAYIVDQSTSMKPTAIQAVGKDTTGWYECGGGKKFTCTGSISFHGAQVCQIPSTLDESSILAAGCKEAGDAYSARAEAVYAAIRSQADRVPGSYAATINFNHGVWSTQTAMTKLDAAGVNRLLTTVPLDVGNYTNYEAPLDWARILLGGGTNANGTSIAASPSAGKAILLISDGHPNDGDWQKALDAVDTVAMEASMFPGAANAAAYAGKWTERSASMPPVYGIYLGRDSASATVLRTISQRTGGSFHLIPPNQPDSLSRVIEGILGELIRPMVPSTFSITNLANGTVSKAGEPVLDAAAGGYRVPLDSLLPLEPGKNTVVLRTQTQEGGKTSTLLDTLVVDVAGAGAAAQGALGFATSLASRCYAATTLSLSPDASGLPYAEASRADANLKTRLVTVPDAYGALPISLATTGRSDREGISLAVPAAAPDTVLGTFDGSIAWSGLAGGNAAPGDGAVRSGYGWDTAIARFQMPRDRRDTASARLALHRSTTPRIEMTESVIGPTGTVSVTVVDSSVAGNAVVVVLRGASGTDSLALTLVGGADHVFSAEFRFEQGGTVDRTDAVLELPAADGTDQAIRGVYVSVEGTLRATTVVSTDLAPLPARIVDTDADGRADRVYVVLRQALKVSDSIGFSWPDTSGRMQTRSLPLSAGKAGADGLHLTFDVEPFAFGATSCPVAGCEGLGALWSSRSTTRSSIPFAIEDDVDPVPTWARYRYAALPTGPDTLIAGFSERVEAVRGGTWVSVGDPLQDSLGRGVVPRQPAWLDDASRTAYFLVDSTFPGTKGDKLRITNAAAGALADTAGNAPDRFAHWTPVKWGEPRPVLDLQVPHPVVELRSFDWPEADPPLVRFVRATEDAPWTLLDGGRSDEVSRYSGLVVRLNRIPETLKIYIYDNAGVDVLSLQFDDLPRLVESGALVRTRRGDYELWFAWNGKDAQGRMVSSGVYLMRLLARLGDDEYGRLVLHGVRKVGIHRSLPVP